MSWDWKSNPFSVLRLHTWNKILRDFALLYCVPETLCGIAGFRSLFRDDWLDHILSWQRKPYGCWGENFPSGKSFKISLKILSLKLWLRPMQDNTFVMITNSNTVLWLQTMTLYYDYKQWHCIMITKRDTVLWLQTVTLCYDYKQLHC